MTDEYSSCGVTVLLLLMSARPSLFFCVVIVDGCSSGGVSVI